jgi:membrane protein implicated in regulation of membrane protease activity
MLGSARNAGEDRIVDHLSMANRKRILAAILLLVAICAIPVGILGLVGAAAGFTSNGNMVVPGALYLVVGAIAILVLWRLRPNKDRS